MRLITTLQWWEVIAMTFCRLIPPRQRHIASRSATKAGTHAKAILSGVMWGPVLYAQPQYHGTVVDLMKRTSKRKAHVP
jgi:hypothetical protein